MARQTNDQYLAANAISALCSIGKDAIPALIELMNDPNCEHPEGLALRIACMPQAGTNALPTIPHLIQILEEPITIQKPITNALRRVHVCLALERIGGLALEPEISVPALTNFIVSSDAFKVEAINALGMFGDKAGPAANLLLLLRDQTSPKASDPAVSRAAGAVLEKLSKK